MTWSAFIQLWIIAIKSLLAPSGASYCVTSGSRGVLPWPTSGKGAGMGTAEGAKRSLAGAGGCRKISDAWSLDDSDSA
jgi:hypothetical protein